LLKNYSAAMVAAERFSDNLAKRLAKARDDSSAEATDKALAEATESVAFLGRIYGFLGGPAQPKLAIDQRRESEKKIVDKLPAELQEVFATARDSVLQRFVEMTDS